jgi:dolichol-phosphate mannosyltransferase
MNAPPNSASLELSVVVPVRDEAGNVARIAAEIHDALKGLASYELVFVDDGSRDATPGELAGLSDPKVRVFTHAAPCGQSQATITGVVQARGSWIATLDGDGQNDPADLPRLLAERDRAGAEASRTLFIGERARRRDGFPRVAASRIANGIRGLVLGDATPDSGCGIKLVARDLVLALPRFDALHRFMPALVIRAGGRVRSVPVAHRPRVKGASKYTIWRRALIGIVDMLGVFWLMRRNTRPTLK